MCGGEMWGPFGTSEDFRCADVGTSEGNEATAGKAKALQSQRPNWPKLQPNLKQTCNRVENGKHKKVSTFITA